ncbi:MAG: MBL fold metallo-hydrolase [Myxococcota bacterium]|nr:MBL fold metallo-hydrolase [Myxococcota bacterium]
MIELHFIGTSDAFGAGGRRQSAFLVREPNGTLLVDCGVTTNTGLTAEGVRRNDIDAIAISHFHADHFGGIPLFLLASLYEDQRRNPLQIAGPPGIEQRVVDLAAAMGHPIPGRNWTFEIKYVELPAGKTCEVASAQITSFEVFHNKDVSPHGMQLQFDSRRIVYSGDTGWFDELPEHTQGADVFVCECTYCTAGFEMHLSLEQLEAREKELAAERTILTHLGGDMSRARKEVGYETADDGLRVKL